MCSNLLYPEKMQVISKLMSFVEKKKNLNAWHNWEIYNLKYILSVNVFYSDYSICPFLPLSFCEILQDLDDMHGINERSKLYYQNERYKNSIEEVHA